MKCDVTVTGDASLQQRQPVPGVVGAVPLSSVLEPVADLRGRQAGRLGQLALVARRRVRVVRVPLAQHRTRPLLEAVRRLLAVPDGARQRELLAHAVLADGAQRTTSLLLRLHTSYTPV